MFEKNLKLAYLLDFYGDVLDGHTREIMEAYYHDDLSLSEIAEGIGISRQGVRHLIKKGEEQLEFLESRLGLAERNEELKSCSATLQSHIEKIKKICEVDFSEDIASLTAIADLLSNKS